MFVGLDGVFDVFIGIGRVFGILLLYIVGYLKCLLYSGGLIVIIVVFGF